jgi:HK97 family phage prohead protease
MSREQRHQAPNIERRVYSAEFRMTDSDKRTVVGHAAIFNTWGDGGWFRERINPGAFANALQGSDIRALFNHDPNYLLARNTSGTLQVREDADGLYVEFDIPKSQEHIRESLERGDLNQMSFAFTIERDEWRYNDNKDERTILEFRELYDVSLVTYPFYKDTSAALRSFEAYKATKQQEEQQHNAHIKQLLDLRIRSHSLILND